MHGRHGAVKVHHGKVQDYLGMVFKFSNPDKSIFKKPNQKGKKLEQLIRYCNGIKNDKLILSADNLYVIKWYVASTFATMINQFLTRRKSIREVAPKPNWLSQMIFLS